MAKMAKREENSLFAKPNLKLFLLGAALILVVNDVFTGATIQASARTVAKTAQADGVTDKDLLKLLQHAIKHPTSEAFYQLSYYHQKRGEFKKAKAYLQRAEALLE